MTPAERAQVLREEADAIETDRRYGPAVRLTTPAILRARADRYDTEGDAA